MNRTHATTIAAILIAGAALLPEAEAHLQTYSDARSITAGPWSVTLYPTPSPLFNGTDTKIQALVYESASATIERSVNGTLELSGPGGFKQTLPLTRNRTEYLDSSSFQFPQRGNYTVTFAGTKNGTTHQGSASLDVYPNLPLRLQPMNEGADPLANQPYSLLYQVMDAASGIPMENVTDLRVRAERWTDDHGRKLGEEEFDLAKIGGGTWQAIHAFPETGMWHLWFRSTSGGFEYYDTPMWHVYAGTAPETGGASPGLAPMLVWLVLAAALVIVRRRP